MLQLLKSDLSITFVDCHGELDVFYQKGLSKEVTKLFKYSFVKNHLIKDLKI